MDFLIFLALLAFVGIGAAYGGFIGFCAAVIIILLIVGINQ